MRLHKPFRTVGSVLRFAEDIHRLDRVVIVTDEQSHDTATRPLPVAAYVRKPHRLRSVQGLVSRVRARRSPSLPIRRR